MIKIVFNSAQSDMYYMYSDRYCHNSKRC